MMLKFESKIGKSDAKGRSSRTIIPKEVMQLLELEWGDKLVWNVNIGEKGVTVSVSPKKEED